jgi:LETM1 and EF-hand domain-containing protein 1
MQRYSKLIILANNFAKLRPILSNQRPNLFTPFINNIQSNRFNSNDSKNKLKNPANVAAPVPVKINDSKKKLTIWEKIKHEANHYWGGTKLLGLEIKISSRLLLKMTAGYELTRREYRQLQRTTADVLRLFPFAMFVLIPFAELLLPIALKLFPNLLPSTYESEIDKEKKMAKLRNTRYKVAQVLTNSKQMINLPSTLTNEQILDFKDFMFKLNNSKSDEISRQQLLRVAKMFKDDLILDNVERGILIAMANYINIKPYGTDQILRYRIRHKMLKIKEDDRLIDEEGVNSLSLLELQQACASRGIHMYNATPGQMRQYLYEWLDMRLHEKIPSTLMILVNAYTYGEVERYSSTHEALKAVISSLPAEVYHEQELQVDLDNATIEQKLKVLKEQEHLIKSENVQEEGHKVLVKDKLSLDDDNNHKPTETEKKK